MKIKDIEVKAVFFNGQFYSNDSIVGSGRDEQACIGSAGFSWCKKTKSCERPWELAKKHSFDNTKDAFNNYCNNPVE